MGFSPTFLSVMSLELCMHVPELTCLVQNSDMSICPCTACTYTYHDVEIMKVKEQKKNSSDVISSHADWGTLQAGPVAGGVAGVLMVMLVLLCIVVGYVCRKRHVKKQKR